MSKDAERNYLKAIGEAGLNHASNKPFSNDDCGLTLASIGAVMHLLPPRPAKILDLGCGTGWTSMFLARHGYEVVGRDIAEDMIAVAQSLKADQAIGDHLQFEVGDFEDSDISSTYDAVIFFDSLHHAEDEAQAIRFAAQALKPGGVMITHEPGEGHSTAPHSIAAMEQFGVTEKDMPPHLIMHHAREAGFTQFRIFPMQHDLYSSYYGPIPRSLFSKQGLRRARELLKMAFAPSQRASAIVVSQKGE